MVNQTIVLSQIKYHEKKAGKRHVNIIDQGMLGHACSLSLNIITRPHLYIKKWRVRTSMKICTCAYGKWIRTYQMKFYLLVENNRLIFIYFTQCCVPYHFCNEKIGNRAGTGWALQLCLFKPRVCWNSWLTFRLEASFTSPDTNAW